MFDIITYVSIALYLIIALGLSIRAPQYLNDLQYYTKIYVALFLVIRFNPFNISSCTELDAKIAFSAGVFLLSTSALVELFLVPYNYLLDIFRRQVIEDENATFIIKK
jgi:membrane protein YdbS with pleckstrin-like domain